jgi:endonuclease/exonuclease/phosphatase family metal-dependent hydrolase
VDIIDSIEPDFILFQELDTNSSRSFYIDQLSYLNAKYPNYSYAYGKNNKIGWLPKPLLRPTGKVESGLAIFSKYFANLAKRYSLPGQQDGFHKFFDFDRAFVEKRYELENGKELVIINLHLSDFNETGRQRFEELRYIDEYLHKEYKNGAYIIVGGDWNHNLPGTDPYLFEAEEEWPSWLKNLPEEFEFEGFRWAVDKYTPTVRSLNSGFNKGYNFMAVTDGFLVSDNLHVIRVRALDHGFASSYHNPVILEFMLE